MRSYEKDYRYLLLNLVPQRRLSPDLRRSVASALESGNPVELRRQSVLALEELCATDYLVRTGLRRHNNEIIADYKKTGGRYRLRVALPVDEWSKRIYSVAEVDFAEEVPRREETDVLQFPVTAAPSVELVKYLPEIVQTFSVPDRTGPMLNRLELLLNTVKRWLDFAGVRLFLLEDIVNITDVTGELIETIGGEELGQNEFYRVCIESGSQRLVPRSKAAAALTEDAPVDWDYLGVAPVFALGKVCGILKIFFFAGIDEVTKKSRLEAAATLVKQAIEFNSQIENITSVDALTQVYNRHFYDTQVSVEIERAMRSGNEVSMLVIDLDDFKKINDEMGHKKGDEALKAVAEIIRKNLRKVDLPFRYGGEEFVILLPGTSEFESVHTAERLRRVIGEYTGFKDLHSHIRRITVCIGVSVFPDTANSADELFNQADTAMYRAKQLGKDRVVLFKSDMKLGQG